MIQLTFMKLEIVEKYFDYVRFLLPQFLHLFEHKV